MPLRLCLKRLSAERSSPTKMQTMTTTAPTNKGMRSIVTSTNPSARAAVTARAMIPSVNPETDILLSFPSSSMLMTLPIWTISIATGPNRERPVASIVGYRRRWGTPHPALPHVVRPLVLGGATMSGLV